MTIMRFVKTPNSPVMESAEGEKTVFLINHGPPDDVRLPPELGGFVERVKESFMGPCPHCRSNVRHLVLESCSVAECDQFYWYRKREDNDQ